MIRPCCRHSRGSTTPWFTSGAGTVSAIYQGRHLKNTRDQKRRGCGFCRLSCHRLDGAEVAPCISMCFHGLRQVLSSSCAHVECLPSLLLCSDRWMHGSTVRWVCALYRCSTGGRFIGVPKNKWERQRLARGRGPYRRDRQRTDRQASVQVLPEWKVTNLDLLPCQPVGCWIRTVCGRFIVLAFPIGR